MPSVVDSPSLPNKALQRLIAPSSLRSGGRSPLNARALAGGEARGSTADADVVADQPPRARLLRSDGLRNGTRSETSRAEPAGKSTGPL